MLCIQYLRSLVDNFKCDEGKPYWLTVLETIAWHASFESTLQTFQSGLKHELGLVMKGMKLMSTNYSLQIV